MLSLTLFLEHLQRLPNLLFLEQSDLDSPWKQTIKTTSKASPQATLNQDTDRYCSIGRCENNTPIPGTKRLCVYTC